MTKKDNTKKENTKTSNCPDYSSNINDKENNNDCNLKNMELNKKENMNDNKKSADTEQTEVKETEINDNNTAKHEDEIAEDIRDEKFLELQARYDDLNDKYLRLFSEFDNYRKRTSKEKLELIKSASHGLIELLLPVLDDLDRAVESLSKDESQKSAKEGLEIVLNKFKTILRQQGVEEIKAIGEDFNTDYHEALTNVEVENKEEKGKIKDVILKGYMLNDKVLRFAKVVVAN